MSLNSRRITLTCITLYIATLSAFSQYEGGNGSGFVCATEIQVTCPVIIYSSIFYGGQEGGVTLSGITQRQCSPTSTPHIFNGGGDNGYSLVGIAQGMCSPGVIRNVHKGGSENLGNNITLIQVSCPLIIYSSIFYGGQEGGYTLSGITQRQCSPTTRPHIFNGGWDDGYSQVGMKQSMCSPGVFRNVFRGGSENSAVNTTLYAGCTPVADFEASPLVGCAGDTINFTDLSLHNPTSWLWSFPGGNPSGSTVQNPSVVYNDPGIYSISLSVTSQYGNNVISRINYLTINAPSVGINSISPLCINDSAYVLSEGSPVGGIYSGPYITSGVFDLISAGIGNHSVRYTFTDGLGCSNHDTAILIINPFYDFNADYQICSGETYNWHGNDYTATGVYTANYNTIDGCDSIYTLHLTAHPVYAYTENHSTCNGETYTWHGNEYSSTGVYTANYTSANGCDSVYTLHLTVNPAYAYTENDSICSGETYTWHGNNYTSAGVYTANYTGIDGCDSVFTLHLTVNPKYAYSEYHGICNGEIYTWHGNDFTSAGVYTANYTGINGCDSVYTLNLSISTPDVSVTYSGTTITANLAGAAYQWVNCDNAYENIDGATLQTFSVEANGNYAVIVKQDLCSDTSECILVSGVGIGSFTRESITIYPNPVKNELFIEIKGTNEKIHFIISNIMGQIFYEGTFIENTVVKTSGFPKGVYILKLERGRNIYFAFFTKD